MEQKENKTRVLKPVAKRSLHGTPHNTPRPQPPQLPALSEILSPSEPPRSGPNPPPPSFPAALSKSTGFLSGSKPFSSWRAPSAASTQSDNHPAASAPSAPSTPAITGNVEPAVKSEVGIAFSTAESDQCSSDEEFSMENEISLSQDKLNSLSVHDISDHLLEDGKDDQPHMMMQLAPGFASMLSEQEEKLLKEIGAYTVPLKLGPDPIILGRDHYYPVFGDKIRGCETFHLSRRHCVFHVSMADSKDSSKQYKVVVENTSTNGLDVNGRAMKSLEQRELHVGDTVTLLKIRNHGSDISLAYTLLVKTPVSVPDKAKATVAPRRSPRFARGKPSASKVHLARRPRGTDSSSDFALPFSPPKKKMRFPTIRVEVLISDPFVVTSESPRHQSRGFRDELMVTMAALSPVERLAVGYECATKEALFAAVQNPRQIFVYAGGSESNKILVEDSTGMPASVDVKELSAAVGEDGCKPQMVIVFSRSVTTAQVFVDAGIQHVIFVNSSSRTRSKAASYMRSLFASLLKGSSIGESHTSARRAALGDASTSPIAGECLCGILPGGRSHDVFVGEIPKKLDYARVRASLPTLNALLVPSLPNYYLPQEDVIGEVIGALRKNRVQVCSLQGGKGVGKSSTSIYVAKYAVDRRWYKDGVHFFDVEAAFTGGKDSSPSGSLGWTSDLSESDDKRQRITRRFQNEIDELLQLLHPKTTTDTSNTTLIVLDGCDRLHAAQFRDFIVKTVQGYPNVQILITMRQFMTINIHSKIVEECTVQLKELSTTDTAAVFMSMAKVCVDPDRLAQAIPSTSLDTISKHPAVVRLNGNPLLLFRLAKELRNSSLDELQ